MWQALCLTGRGLDTCWRPGSVAKNIHVSQTLCITGLLIETVLFTPVRRVTE